MYEIVASLHYLDNKKELAFDVFINDSDNSSKKVIFM